MFIYLKQKYPLYRCKKIHRECELVCKECILNVIRNNIPVDKILRAYIDETTEEEVIEEQKIEEKPVEKNNIEASFDEVIKNDEPLKNNKTVVEVKKNCHKSGGGAAGSSGGASGGVGASGDDRAGGANRNILLNQ